MLVISFYTRVCVSINQTRTIKPALTLYISSSAVQHHRMASFSLWNSLTRLTKCSGRLPMRNSTRSFLLFGISARNIEKKKLCNHQMTSYFFTELDVCQISFSDGALYHMMLFQSHHPCWLWEKIYIHLCCDLIRSCNVIHLLYTEAFIYIQIIY